MRTVKELELAVLALRAKCQETKEALGVFVLTQNELDLLTMQPMEYHRMVGLPERFCGMELRVV